MKKALVILMLSVYGILSIGVQLHLHYCCGELADVNIFEAKNCATHDDEDHECCSFEANCCTYENLSFKLNDSHNPTYFKLPVISPDQTPIAYSIDSSVITSKTASNYSIEIIHPPTSTPIYVRHHALIFYA